MQERAGEKGQDYRASNRKLWYQIRCSWLLFGSQMCSFRHVQIHKLWTSNSQLTIIWKPKNRSLTPCAIAALSTKFLARARMGCGTTVKLVAIADKKKSLSTEWCLAHLPASSRKENRRSSAENRKSPLQRKWYGNLSGPFSILVEWTNPWSSRIFRGNGNYGSDFSSLLRRRNNHNDCMGAVKTSFFLKYSGQCDRVL